MLPWRGNRWFAGKLLHALHVCKNKIESDITFAWHIKRGARVSFSIMINNLKKERERREGTPNLLYKSAQAVLEENS